MCYRSRVEKGLQAGELVVLAAKIQALPGLKTPEDRLEGLQVLAQLGHR